MPRTLLVTNDFPPRRAASSPSCTTWRSGSRPTRWSSTPRAGAAAARSSTPTSRSRWSGSPPRCCCRPRWSPAARARLARAHGCDTVWFGAAAPLGAARRRAAPAGRRRARRWPDPRPRGRLGGAARGPRRRCAASAAASTWSPTSASTPAARLAPAFGPRRALGTCRPAWTPTTFRPTRRRRAECAPGYGLADRPVVVCVSRLVPRKGQDMLIRALPRDPPAGAGRGAADRRRRPVPANACDGLAQTHGVAEHVVFTGSVPSAELPAHYAAGDVFAMPCRTRGAGLDVEGLGIVYLEASATGLPVVAGDSGGAPDAVREGETGYVVDGRDGRRARRRGRRAARRPGPGHRDGCARAPLGGAGVAVGSAGRAVARPAGVSTVTDEGSFHPNG